MLYVGRKLEEWSDRDPDRRDKILLISGLLVIACFLYYLVKSCPMDYLSDSFEGLGYVSGFVIFRYFERRGFLFDTEMEWKDRFIIAIFAFIPLF